jgi:hypothetical protein
VSHLGCGAIVYEKKKVMKKQRRSVEMDWQGSMILIDFKPRFSAWTEFESTPVDNHSYALF